MDAEQIIDQITPQAYQRLQYAAETGRWPEGERLTPEQRDYCIQAVMLYQSKHNSQPEHMTVAAGGEIKMKSKAEFKRELDTGEVIVRQRVNTDGTRD